MVAMPHWTVGTERPHVPGCDGDNCMFFSGQLRRYPLAGDSAAILCYDCWQFENLTRERDDRIPWGLGRPGESES